MVTDVFLNQKRVNVCEHKAKMDADRDERSSGKLRDNVCIHSHYISIPVCVSVTGELWAVLLSVQVLVSQPSGHSCTLPTHPELQPRLSPHSHLVSFLGISQNKGKESENSYQKLKRSL